MRPDRPALSVVIPAYNEAHRLPASLRRIVACLDTSGRTYEILVVDDGSRDATVAEALSVPAGRGRVRVLRNRRNRGKGASVRRGVAAARGEWILFTDADLSTPIEEWETLARAADTTGSDIAVGSRALRGSRVETRQPFYREWMGKTFNRLVQGLVLPGIHDTQCGFKWFRNTTVRPVFRRMTIAGFGFDVELLYLARRTGCRVVEVPVVWRNVLESKVSPVRDSLRMLGDLFRIRWRHRRRQT